MVDVKNSVSKEEWDVRVDLAAFYRTIPYFGWDDLIFTHISARVPGTEDHFLINPYGFLFDEITASNLVKVDINGKIISETNNPINPAGLIGLLVSLIILPLISTFTRFEAVISSNKNPYGFIKK